MEEKIIKKVRELMRKYHTNDPFKLAQYLGIQVFIVELDEKCAGQYMYVAHWKCILLNASITDEDFLRIVMAHELGHALFHWKTNCSFKAQHTLLKTSRYELEANLFAAYLLVTDDMIEEYENCTYEQFSKATGIREELLRIRIKSYAQALNGKK